MARRRCIRRRRRPTPTPRRWPSRPPRRRRRVHRGRPRALDYLTAARARRRRRRRRPTGGNANTTGWPVRPSSPAVAPPRPSRRRLPRRPPVRLRVPGPCAAASPNDATAFDAQYRRGADAASRVTRTAARPRRHSSPSPDPPGVGVGRGSRRRGACPRLRRTDDHAPRDVHADHDTDRRPRPDRAAPPGRRWVRPVGHRRRGRRPARWPRPAPTCCSRRCSACCSSSSAASWSASSSPPGGARLMRRPAHRLARAPRRRRRRLRPGPRRAGRGGGAGERRRLLGHLRGHRRRRHRQLDQHEVRLG